MNESTPDSGDSLRITRTPCATFPYYTRRFRILEEVYWDRINEIERDSDEATVPGSADSASTNRVHLALTPIAHRAPQ